LSPKLLVEKSPALWREGVPAAAQMGVLALNPA